MAQQKEEEAAVYRREEGGTFSFLTAEPGPVPAPDGQLQALHVMVFACGLSKRLVSRLYFPDEQEANAVDLVLSSIEDRELRRALIVREEDVLRFDIHLQGHGQTAFFEF
jgi:protocatechuate 3,4-dioxygenase, alpha subunit